MYIRVRLTFQFLRPKKSMQRVSTLNEDCNQRANALNCSSKSHCNLLSYNSIQFTLCCKRHQKTACNILKYLQKIQQVGVHMFTFTFGGAVLDFSARAKRWKSQRTPPPQPPACLSANRNICCVHASCKSICDFHFCLPQLSASTTLLVTSYACSALRISLLRCVPFEWTFAVRGLN